MAGKHCFDSVASVLAAVGLDLGATDWLTVTQQRINTFADATGDHRDLHYSLHSFPTRRSSDLFRMRTPA